MGKPAAAGRCGGGSQGLSPSREPRSGRRGARTSNQLAGRNGLARRPNYDFERREREKAKAAKRAARAEAKKARAEQRQAEESGETAPGPVESEDEDGPGNA